MWSRKRFGFRPKTRRSRTFNSTQFTAYRTSFGTAGFGSANGARDPRSIQFGLKLFW